MNFKVLRVLIAVTMLSGCFGQKVFFWEKPSTGVYQFAEDHNYCMRYGDYFPWDVPSLTEIFGTKKLNLKARWTDYNGIWASYLPYEGAEPLTVNYHKRQLTVSSRFYKKCMENKGYTQNRNINVTTHIK